MIFINENNTISTETTIALGIFDGVHLGHREILNTAKMCSAEKNSFSVFTFEISTIKKKHGKPYEYIYTENQKNRIFESMKVEYIYSPNASDIMGMSGEEFSEKILKDKMNAKTVVCGENFRFGKGASCGVNELEKFGEKYDFNVKSCRILESEGKKISSAVIKEYLKNGDITAVNRLLSENYFIEGEIVKGNQIGRTLEFPTINQIFKAGQVIPKKGVYASKCEIEGKHFNAVTNIGVKPTVAHDIMPLAETHILGFSGDLYGKNIKTSLTVFLREEHKFSSIEELKKQIEIDVKEAEGIA